MAKVKKAADLPEDATPAGSVIEHPARNTIPRCKLPLRTREAQEEYDTIARQLFTAGRLTDNAHRYLSSYVSSFDQITVATLEGNEVRASWRAEMRKSLDKLGLDDLETQIAAPKNASENKFSRFGRAPRRG